MNFKESLDYLFGLGFERSVKKFGLENSTVLLKAIGSPQNNFIKIQVAGTNGKGSTCAFLESICAKAGIRVGLNTSPHLISVTERIRVNGLDISDVRFAEYVTRVREVSERLVKTGELEGIPTFFEHITAIAQLVFADEKVELAILETGLGGRFDATTAARAEIAAITPIDLDHTKTLGDTIEKIAAEKAAIIRPDTRVLSARQNEEAKKVISGKCQAMGVEPVWATGAVKFTEDLDRGICYTDYQTAENNYRFDLFMPGRHQQTNAALAVHIAETLGDFGFTISRMEIENGLRAAKHKGRLEYWPDELEVPVLFDGAHNVSGAKALRDYLKEFVDQPVTMIFGTMSGKDLREILRILFPLAENIIFTTSENPRAMSANSIAECLPRDLSRNEIYVIDEIPPALKKATEVSGDDGLVLVTGSLYLIGEIQAFVKARTVERRKKKK